MAIEQFKKLLDDYYVAVADYWDPRTADRRDWPHRRDAAKALYEHVETLTRERDGALTREENTVALFNSERKAIEQRVATLEAALREAHGALAHVASSAQLAPTPSIQQECYSAIAVIDAALGDAE